MEKQQNPDIERKRTWLNRYRESLAEQRRIAEQLEEGRGKGTAEWLLAKDRGIERKNDRADNCSRIICSFASLIV